VKNMTGTVHLLSLLPGTILACQSQMQGISGNTIPLSGWEIPGNAG
jgi:hypothetical protein